MSEVKFNFDNIDLVEFGVVINEADEEKAILVPVDENVQNALKDMAKETLKLMKRYAQNRGGPTKYEPTEKYESSEYIYLSINDEKAGHIKQLHYAENLLLDGNILDKIKHNPSSIFCYFCRLRDKKGQRLTALRKASQFKGILKKRLLSIMTDALRLIDGPVFKLDNNFSILVDSSIIHILRPNEFEFLGKLKEAILASVSKNIEAIRNDIPFVDLDGLEKYAKAHPRAARYLASIKTNMQISGITKESLKRVCEEAGVKVYEEKDKIKVQKGYEMAFLEILDRRRYVIELIEGSPERFKADSRKKL